MTMRNTIFFIACFCLLCCSEDESSLDGKLRIEARSSDHKDNIDAKFMRRHNCFELEITDGVKWIQMNLEDLSVGAYNFGRGEVNTSIWLSSYYSNRETENSGTLQINQNDGSFVSGNFEITFESDLDGSVEIVVGEFENLPIDQNSRKGKSKAIGSVNGILKSTSFTEMNDYSTVHTWRMYRPNREVMEVYINTSENDIGVYELNKDSIPIKNILPHIEYSLNSRLYTSSNGTGTLEILVNDPMNNRLECELNAALGNFQDSSILELKDYRMELYY